MPTGAALHDGDHQLGGVTARLLVGSIAFFPPPHDHVVDRAEAQQCCAHEGRRYTTVYNRFNRWAKAGVWVRVFETLAAKSPHSMALIDSSIIRAHQHAAGGKKGAKITPSAALVAD